MQSTGELLEYRHLIQRPNVDICRRALSNDLGRLAQGIGVRMKSGTNTVFFMHPMLILKDKNVTCVKLVSTIRPLKAEVNRVRVTIGGDRLQCEGDTACVPSSLATVKIHLNSTISTPGACYLNLDIKDFYCGIPMQLNDYEHAQMPLSLIPEEIIKQC